METMTPVIIEDFEIGDRLYRQRDDTGEVVFGTVEEVGSYFLNVRLDDGVFFEVSIDLFQSDANGQKNYVRWWAKSLDVSKLKEGATLSFLKDGEREYVELFSYFPNRHATFSFSDGAKRTYWENSSGTLEYHLRNFEMEG